MKPCSRNVTACRLILASGLRRGEALALSWRSVDFENMTISVTHTLCNRTNKLKAPKTDNSIRTVALDEQILSELGRWKNRQCEYLFSLGIVQNSDTPVITDSTGGRMFGTNLYRWWKDFLKRHKLGHIRLHDLRHTSATLLVSSGLNIKAVSSRIGHSSVALTLDLYGHAQREDDIKAAETIGKIMKASSM